MAANLSSAHLRLAMLKEGAVLTNTRSTLVLGVAVWLFTTNNALAQVSGPVTASVIPYSIKVTILRATDPIDDVLYETVSTSDPKNHSVYCFDGLRDLEYVLHDSNGEIIPLTSTWKDHLDFMSSFSPYNPKGPNGPDPCRAIKASETHPKVRLSWLYPSLQPGSYTLQVILAPRGTAGRATTPALTIMIPDK
jgi:hypothetical protein